MTVRARHVELAGPHVQTAHHCAEQQRKASLVIDALTLATGLFSAQEGPRNALP